MNSTSSKRWNESEPFFQNKVMGATLALCAVLLAGGGAFCFGTPGIFFGFTAFFVLAGATFRFWLLIVPPATGVVTVNQLTGTYYPHKRAGYWLKWPWEKVDVRNFFSMKTVTTGVISENYPTKGDMPGSGGPSMAVKYVYQYRLDPDNMVARVFTDPTTIRDGIGGIASGVLSSEISFRTPEDAKKDREKIDGLVRKAVDEAKVDTGETIAKANGVILNRFSVADIDYPETYQRALDATARSKKIGETAAHFKKERPGISDKDAMNAALLVHGESTTKKIFEVEGLKDIAALVVEGIRGARHAN